MTTTELLQTLRSNGVRLSHWRLRGYIDRGEIGRPRVNSAGNFDWTAAELAKVESVARADAATKPRYVEVLSELGVLVPTA